MTSDFVFTLYRPHFSRSHGNHTKEQQERRKESITAAIFLLRLPSIALLVLEQKPPYCSLLLLLQPIDFADLANSSKDEKRARFICGGDAKSALYECSKDRGREPPLLLATFASSSLKPKDSFGDIFLSIRVIKHFSFFFIDEHRSC